MTQWRSFLWLATAVLLTVGLVGCVPAAGGNRTASAAAGRSLAEVTPLPDPRSHQGPSTATMVDSRLRPIARSPKSTLPASIVDAQGTAVTVTDTRRILALDLSGSLSRIVYELGLGDNLVGRDISSGFDEIKQLPLVTGTGHELSAEAILDLAPTLIITDTSIGPWDVILQMRDAGIPVVIVDSHRDLETVGSLTRQVAAAVGVPAEGETLAQRTESEVGEMVTRIQAIAPTPGLRTVFLYVRGQSGIYYMFGQSSGADSLIRALGGVDVATEIGWKGMQPVNDEGLIAAEPELILMMTHGLESVGGVDGLLEKLPALANTPAGHNRRIVDMADNQVLAFGPGSAQILEALAVAIYAPEPA